MTRTIWDLKRCGRCQQEWPLVCFSKGGSDGYCKNCRAIYKHELEMLAIAWLVSHGRSGGRSGAR